MEKKESLLSRRAILKGLGAVFGFNAVSGIIRCSLFNLQGCDDSNVADIDARDGDVQNKNAADNNIQNNIIAGGSSLRERAARKGLIYGAASDGSFLANDTDFAAHFAKECGMLATEGALKWNAIRPTPDSFDFTRGDYCANFASQNNMLFQGHVLVWHEALPAWFQHTVNSQNAERMLREHIKTVVGHYAGKMHSWDVVNEAIAPWERLPDGMRNTPWLRLLGPKYIDIAFRAAAEADPKAILVYNQNHLEYDSKGSEECRTATLNLLKRLKSAGTPVHALGIQAHLDSADGKFNPTVFKAFLHDVASLDLKIMITELDVIDQNMPYDIALRDSMVAEKYLEFLTIVLEEPSVIAVLTWGLSDKYTWLSTYKPRKNKATVRPLPLDENFHRKLSWNAIAKAFDNAPKRKS